MAQAPSGGFVSSCFSVQCQQIEIQGGIRRFILERISSVACESGWEDGKPAWICDHGGCPGLSVRPKAFSFP
eukprot:3155015-Amphidinium_carterae.1